MKAKISMWFLLSFCLYYTLVGQAPYCASGAASDGKSDITNVTIRQGATIIFSNSTSCGQLATGPGSIVGRYSNYRNLVINLVKGTTYSLDVTHSACGLTFNANTRQLMYLDLDKNFVFDTPSERLVWATAQMVNIGSSASFSTSFSIPSNVVIDTTVMRIITYAVAGGDATQCRTNYGAGETEDYTVTFCEPVTRNRTITQPLCFGQTNGKIKIAASGGRAPLQYAWNGGSYGSADSLVGIAAGTYTLITQDSLGCKHYDTILLSQPSALTLGKQIDKSCQQTPSGKIILTGSGGKPSYRYRLGSSGSYDTARHFSLLARGSYIVSVRDSNLCVQTDTLLVDSFPLYPLVKEVDSILCRSKGGSIRLRYQDIFDPTKYTHYSYNGGAWTPLAMGLYDANFSLDSGRHIVIMRDLNGCQIADTTHLSAPPPTILSVISMSPVGCNGMKGRIQVQRTGGNPALNYLYYWSHLGTTSTKDSFHNLDTGTYLIAVRDDKFCDTTKVTVKILDIAARIVPSYTLLTPFNCPSDSQQIVKLQASGGTAPYRFSFFTLDYPEWNYKTMTFPAFGAKDTLHLKNTNPFKQLFIYVKIRDTNFCETDTAFFIRPSSIVYPSPTPIPNPSCAGDSISIRMNLIDKQYAQPPIRFSIHGKPFTTDTLLTGVVASSGLHTITVQHGAGCVDYTQVNINTLPNITASFTAIHPSCIAQNNGEIRVMATGGTNSYTYTLNNVQTQPGSIFMNLGPGTYQVKVEDGNGCKKTATLTLNPVSYQLKADILQIIRCFGTATGSLRVTLSGSDIQPGVLYSLNGSSPSIQNTWTGLSAGTYTIRMQYNGSCTKDTLVTLTEPSLLKANYTATNLQLRCHGDRQGSIQLTPTGGTPPYSLFLNGGTVPVQNRTNLGAGSYIIALQDSRGCLDTQTFVFTEPSKLKLDTSLVIEPTCHSSSNGRISVQTSGGTLPHTIGWSTGETVPDRTGLSAGLYLARVVDQNLCSDSLAILLREPTRIQILEKLEQISCYGYNDGKIDLRSEGGTLPHSYSWNDGTTTAQRTNLPPGNYQVTVTDAKSCQHSASYSILEPDRISSRIVIKDATCPNTSDGSIRLTPQGGTVMSPLDYRVSLDQRIAEKKQIFEFLAPKLYTIKIWDNRDCFLDTQALVAAPTMVTIDLDAMYQVPGLGETITLNPRLEPNTAQVSVQWYPSSGLSCSDCLNPIFSGFTSQAYTLVYRYQNNRCGDSVRTFIKVSFADPTTIYIPSAFSPNGEGDPENETFKIYGPHILRVDMQIFNRWGEKVFATDNKLQGWDGNYRGEPAPVGTYSYSLHITLLDGSKIMKNGEVTLLR